MSIKVTYLVRDYHSKNLTSTEKFVLFTLATHSGDDGQNCYPSQALLTKETNLSLSSIKRIIRSLISKAFIFVLKKGVRQGQSTEYRINIAKLQSNLDNKVVVELKPTNASDHQFDSQASSILSAKTEQGNHGLADWYHHDTSTGITMTPALVSPCTPKEHTKEHIKNINICEVETSPVVTSVSDSVVKVEATNIEPINIQEAKTKKIEDKTTKRPTKNKENPLVLGIFEFWQNIYGRHRAKLDNERERRIKWALKNYPVEDLKKAIVGCSKTPYNMGYNDSGREFNNISLIFRDAEHIEEFMEYADNPPKLNWGKKTYGKNKIEVPIETLFADAINT